MRIKKAYFNIVLVLFLVIGLVLPIILPQPAQAQTVGWLADYTYRKALWVTGSPEGPQTNYQTRVRIFTGAGTDNATYVYLNSHNATAPCVDIRFTTDDGITLLDYWTEDQSTAPHPIVTWVEFNSLPAHPKSQMFYMYYGNAGAADASNIGTTFIVADDFEGGVDGGNLNGQALPTGGTWTVTNTVEYDDNDTIAPWGGSLIAKMVGAGALPPEVCTPLTPSNNIAIMYRGYKETATVTFQIRHGTGTILTAVWGDQLEDILYFNGAWQDTGFNMAADVWTSWELRDFDWTGNTFDLFYNDASIGNDLDMGASPLASNLLFFIGAATATQDGWYDNVIVRNWTENEPWVEAWGNEHRNAGIETHYVSGRGENWAIMNAEITGVHAGQTVSQRGFDYGITQAMPQSWTEAGAWTGSQYFDRVQNSLIPGASYYFRAKTYDGTAWSYGEQKRLSLSAQQYEWWESNDSYSTQNATGTSWLFQSFTVNDIAFILESVELELLRVGAPSIVTVSVKATDSGEPIGEDLASATLDGNIFSDTTATWYRFFFDSEITLEYDETYAIVVKALAGDATKYIRWRQDSGGGMPNGNAGYTEGGGSPWTQALTLDNVFRIWGNPALEIEGVKVFTDYIEADDWLITIIYANVYPPYYNIFNVQNYFVLQLVDSADTVQAQVSCPSWDYKPGSIYLAPSEVTGLTYGGEYTVRLYGTFTANPFANYALQANDWLGSDLTQLDNLVISAAKLLADYYGVVMTTYIADRGEVLNEVGGVIFSLGITALTIVRPHLFQIVSTPLQPPSGVFPHLGEGVTTWQAMMGPDITARLTDFGSVVGIDGKTTAAWMLIGVMLVLMVWALPTGHAAAANIIATPIFLMGLGLRVFDWATGAVMLTLMVFLLMYHLWFKYG